MPGTSIAFAITTGLGVSVVAGILSGVCYVLKCRRKTRRRPITPFHCAVCDSPFTFGNTIFEIDKDILCVVCKLKVCKNKCSNYSNGHGWICQNCDSNSWLSTLCQNVSSNHKMNENKNYKFAEKDKNVSDPEQEKIRDFIESLLTTLLGGELGSVCTGKIYKNDEYHFMYKSYHDKISGAITNLGSALLHSVSNLPILGQSPCTAHESLKLLIQRFIVEAAELPALQKVDKTDLNLDSEHAKPYEDLLSSAIINKVIHNYQNGSNSYAESASSSSNTSRKKNKREHILGERNAHPRQMQDESSSMSSLEDWILTEKKSRTPNNSLSIQSRIVERISSDDDEGSDGGQVDTDWQENWLLQKRKFDGTHSPVPVPMLVPNPISDAKVLIGGKEVDEASDLSDSFSDYDDYEYEAAPSSLNAVLVNSKSVIGGKNQVEKIAAWVNDFQEVDQIEETGVTDENFESYEDEKDIIETVNEKMISEKDVENESILSYDSNAEQDLEYTESFPTLPRKVLKPPQPLPRNTIGSIYLETEGIKAENIDSGVTSDEDDKLKSKKPEFIGSYSEREKRKWNEAVELSNNPYSKSNLERRLSNRSSSSSISSLYSRDYYIKESAKPAGSKDAKSPEITSENVIHVRDLVSMHEDKIKPDVAKIYRATPVFALDDEQLLKPSLVPKHVDVFTSDSDYSIERSYNLNSGEILKHGKSNLKTPQGSIASADEDTKMDSLQSLENTKDFENSDDIDDEYDRFILQTPIIQICPAKPYFGSSSENEFSLAYSDLVDHEGNVSLPDENEIDYNQNIKCVKEMVQIFDSEKNMSQNQLHSLTARSIPAKLKESLRDDPFENVNIWDKDLVSEIKPVSSSELQNRGDQSNQESDIEILPEFTNTRKKIEFFESLRKK